MSKKNTVDTETAETVSAQSEPVAEETAKTVEAPPAAVDVKEQPAKKSCNCVSKKEAEARNFRNQEILLNWNRSV